MDGRWLLATNLFTALMIASTGGTWAQPASEAALQSLSVEVDVDYYGADYRSFLQKSPDANECRAACAAEAQCQAYTFLRPPMGGPTGKCHLKSAVPTRRSDPCCISGRKSPGAQAAQAQPYDEFRPNTAGQAPAPPSPQLMPNILPRVPGNVLPQLLRPQTQGGNPTPSPPPHDEFREQSPPPQTGISPQPIPPTAPPIVVPLAPAPSLPAPPPLVAPLWPPPNPSPPPPMAAPLPPAPPLAPAPMPIQPLLPPPPPLAQPVPTPALPPVPQVAGDTPPPQVPPLDLPVQPLTPPTLPPVPPVAGDIPTPSLPETARPLPPVPVPLTPADATSPSASPNGEQKDESSQASAPTATDIVPLHFMTGDALTLAQLDTRLEARYGGRATAVDITPTADRILVSTESGGLFRSVDRGRNWSHIDSFPVARMIDVRSSRDSPWIVVAAATRDFEKITLPSGRRTTGGGIWVSRSGGERWVKADLGGDACLRDNDTAYGIAFEQGTGRVFVGTDCGLAISDDRGETWRIEKVNGGNSTVQSVVARRGIVDVCGDDGHWRLDIDRNVWIDTGLRENCRGPHALALSPSDPNTVYIAAIRPPTADECDPSNPPDNVFALMQNRARGGNWSGQNLNSPVICRISRLPYIRATGLASADGVAQTYDLVYGNGVDSFRMRDCRPGRSPTECSSDSEDWVGLAISHADSNDVAFSPSEAKCPLVVTHDGGVDLSDDCGTNWENIGTDSGYNALQLYQIAGQIYPRHTHYYMGTQDNSVWGSENTRDWINRVCCEGGGLSMRRRVDNEDEPQIITGIGIGHVGNFKAEPLLQNPVGWADADRENEGQPIWVAPRTFVQVARGDIGEIHISDDEDSNWTPLITLNAEMAQVMGLAGPADDPVLYVPVKTDSGTGLLRVDNIVGSQPADWTFADGRTAEADRPSLILVPHARMFHWRRVFGASRFDADLLLAVDGRAATMKWSRDGGVTWTRDDDLADLLTDNDRFALTRYDQTSVSVIYFDPTDENRIFIGTDANGIFVSLDKGDSFAKVPGSEQISLVSDFFVDELREEVFVASFGRGLWRLTIPEPPPPDRFEDNDTPETATAEDECSLTYFAPVPDDVAANPQLGSETRELWRFACPRARLSDFDDVDFYKFTLPEPRREIAGRSAISECGSIGLEVPAAVADRAEFYANATVRAYVVGAAASSDDAVRVYPADGDGTADDRLANPRACPRTIDPINGILVSYGERDGLGARAAFPEYTLYVDYEIVYGTSTVPGPADPRLVSPMRCWSGFFPYCFRDDSLRFFLPCLADGPGCFGSDPTPLEVFRPFQWRDDGALFRADLVVSAPINVSLINYASDDLKPIAVAGLPQKLPDGRLKYRLQVGKLPEGTFAFRIKGAPQEILMNFDKPPSSKEFSGINVPGFLQPSPWP